MPEPIYSSQVVKSLFEEMAATYGVVNLISSFGFCRIWRWQCIELAEIGEGHVVYDFMTGMGECLPGVTARSNEFTDIRAIDFCSAMCRRARDNTRRLSLAPSIVVEEDVLDSSLPSESADRIVCCFGLKTLDAAQTSRLAWQINRVLKPGGRFSFIEISEPGNPLLRATYLPYIRHVIPLIGRLFLGNPDNYRQLGVYTSAFQDCGRAASIFAEQGLEVSQRSFFFGCATGITGSRPIKLH